MLTTAEIERQRNSDPSSLLADRCSIRGHYPQDTADGIVRQEPQRAVGPGANIADALAEVPQQCLLANHPLAGEDEPVQGLPAQRTDEQISLPLREEIAGVERHA